MQPNLIGVAGPLAGQKILLSASETTIGRLSTNRVPVEDNALSRRHCVVRWNGKDAEIEDFESRNGTFVNGVPIHLRTLSDGDRIEIGDSLFLYRTDTDEVAVKKKASITAVQMVKRQGAVTRLLTPPEFASESAALLKITTLLVLLENLFASRGGAAQMPLSRQLFSLLFDFVPADRGAIFTDNAGEELDMLCCWDEATRGEFPVDSSTVEACIEAAQPVTSTLRDSSAIAVPIALAGRDRAVLYLESEQADREFSERDTEVLIALASIIALGLNNAREKEFLTAENRELRSNADFEHDMIGESASMRKLYNVVARVARGETTVLIRGESGTGKELVARAIHRNSPRAGKTFVAINCAAITDTLLESEFFGHEKGSFTGAIAQKKGKLEMAEGGTVFLDEVGELAPAMQAKLLRVLQEHEFERVGGTKTIKADIRVIAATNRDLEAAIRAGTFRQDLFYRLNVVAVEIRPLRERREDIPLLAAFFAQKYSRRARRQVRGISDRARACLLAYDWPGNVRELENAVERAVVLGTTEVILAEDLPDAIIEAQPVQTSSGSFHEAVRDTKKRLIIDALDENGWNFTEAAKKLDLHPNYLHRLVTQLQLRR